MLSMTPNEYYAEIEFNKCCASTDIPNKQHTVIIAGDCKTHMPDTQDTHRMPEPKRRSQPTLLFAVLSTPALLTLNPHNEDPNGSEHATQ